VGLSLAANRSYPVSRNLFVMNSPAGIIPAKPFSECRDITK
jgi:hypothetical protein